MVFTRALVFILTFIGGIGIIRYAEPIVRSVGHMEWAERTFGAGGSYTVWKLAGVFVIIVGFLYAVGKFNLSPNQTFQVVPPAVETGQ
jgi:hypothetical protein